jgi:hypothetical protein
MALLVDTIKRLLLDVVSFAQYASAIKLRNYQQNVAYAIVNSVIRRSGLSFVVMFPRQSGKNELQAQIETYLLTLFSQLEAEMVKVSPTWKPQSLNAMRRLERVLDRNLLTKTLWLKESGYIYRVGKARLFFFSGSPEANIVGATANTLLEVDEAQDVSIAKFDKDVAPMAASTNATRVFWGTAWTSKTLLAREFRAARDAEKKDGIKRVFVLDADQVAAEVAEYGQFVREQIAKLGRNHPMVKTQYFSEEIDAEGGLFPPARQALMHGDHLFQTEPFPGRVYALCLDVAGADETSSADDDFMDITSDPRDFTSLSIFEVDLSTLQDELIKSPTYRLVYGQFWHGVKHADLYPQLKAIADLWKVRYLAVDATGVGAGLASFLSKAYPDRVIPFLFNSNTKSRLGWQFLSVVETGRFKFYKSSGLAREAEYSERFWQEVDNCQCEVMGGPNKVIRWSVPDGTRDVISGQFIHDDLLVSASLCALLDDQEWFISTGGTVILNKGDPLEEISGY